MITYIAVTVIVFSLMMFVNNIRSNPYVGFLCAFLLLYATYAITHYQTFFGENPTMVAISWNNFSPFYVLSGPTLYFYVKSSLEDSFKWKNYYLLHLIPCLLILIGILPYYFLPFEEKIHNAERIIQDVNNIKTIKMNWLFSNITIYLSRPLIILSYIIASAALLFRNNKKETNPTRQYKLFTRWLTILLSISFILIVILAIMGSNLFKTDSKNLLINLKDLHSLAGGIFLLLPLSILLSPQLLYGIPVIEKDKINKLNISVSNTSIKKSNEINVNNQEAFKLLSEKILEYFENEKPYLKQNFSLTELAAALNVPQHHISYCFSDFLDTNFTKLRASKRAAYAQNLLQQGITKDFTIDKVAEMSGFSSRSTFFSTFKEYTGMTPTEFLEQTK